MNRLRLLVLFLVVVTLALLVSIIVNKSYIPEECLSAASRLHMSSANFFPAASRLSSSSESYYGAKISFHGGIYNLIYSVKLEKSLPDKGDLCILDDSLSKIEFRDSFLINSRDDIHLEMEDLDGDRYEDIAIKANSNYGVQSSFNLLLYKDTKFIRVEGFDKIFAPKFDYERDVLTSFLAVPPARGGYAYSEYEWQNNSPVKVKEITQEVQMIGDTPTPSFLVRIYSIGADGGMKLVREFVSKDYVANPGDLEG